MNNDLISRSALFKSWDGLSDEIKDPNLLIDEMIKRTQEAPTVDAEPVRHGWLELTLEDCVQCSECHAEWAIRDRGEFIEFEVQEDLKWCPSCGAKMDAEVKS